MSASHYTTFLCSHCNTRHVRLISRSGTQRHFCNRACAFAYWSDIPARFWERVQQGSIEDCWLWLGNYTENGYGVVSFSRLPIGLGMKGRSILTHRLAYFLHHGTINPDLLVCHSCDIRGCCNYAHLWQGTHADNTHDMMDKGRMRIGAHKWQREHPEAVLRGEHHPWAKLTNAQVEEMRLLYTAGGWSYKRLGQRFGVSANAAWEAVTKHTYRDSDGDNLSVRLPLPQGWGSP